MALRCCALALSGRAKEDLPDSSGAAAAAAGQCVARSVGEAGRRAEGAASARHAGRARAQRGQLGAQERPPARCRVDGCRLNG